MIVKQAPPDQATADKIHGVLNRQVNHMTKLLDDVFDMSRIATGKLRIDLESVDMVQVVRQALEIAQMSISIRQQKLSYDLPDSPVNTLGDQVRLVQVFANLLDNASKYTPEGGSISLEWETDMSSVGVTITDTGIGITREALPKVFDLFVQDAHAARYNGRGLGIGLSLVKNLIDAHHGVISAYSAGTDLGSQFTVTLKRLPAGA